MKSVELIIIIGNQFVCYQMDAALVKETNADLLIAVETHGWFSRAALVFARGDEIAGWYYREIKPSSVDAINRMAAVIEKQANAGDEWRPET